MLMILKNCNGSPDFGEDKSEKFRQLADEEPTNLSFKKVYKIFFISCLIVFLFSHQILGINQIKKSINPNQNPLATHPLGIIFRFQLRDLIHPCQTSERLQK